MCVLKLIEKYYFDSIIYKHNKKKKLKNIL